MSDETLLAALAGAVVGEVAARPGDGLDIVLSLPEWCGQPLRMPRRVTLSLDGLVDPEAVQARLAALDERGREIAAIAERRARAGGHRLEIAFAGGAAPLAVECRDYAISTDA